MLSQQELVALLNDLESDRVERTASTKDTDKFCEAICAFSNDFPNHRKPGYLLIGADNNGRPSGLAVTDELLKNLGGIRSDGNIVPLPAMTVQKYELPEGELAVVEVFPSDLPPVRYKGRTWIRVGPRRAIASEIEERILSERRTSLLKTFDAKACAECQLDDLLQDVFMVTYRPNAIAADILKENNREIKQQLASLRFYNMNRDCATYAGAILFGKSPLRFVPGDYIQFLRIQGTRLTDPAREEHVFSGDLLTLLREMDTFLPIQLQATLESVSALREAITQDYPLVALRELLMNAVMHRTYESNSPIRFYWFADRIEIQSPGGLFGEATRENFPNQNSYRNPVIAEAMKVLGYVNKFGRGVLRAQEALKGNGNPPLQFVFEPTHFLVTIRRAG